MLNMLSPPLVVLLVFAFARLTHGGTVELEQVMDKMEQDVKELARTVEDQYFTRCTTALDGCYQSNYNTCYSRLPSPTCPISDEFAIEQCLDVGCGALFDYSTSTVALPKEIAGGDHGNPKEDQVIETICYSRQLDSWFQDKARSDAAYWANFGADSPQMFVGAQDGSFRIYPGRRYRTCGEYDPRKRPWYIAASSGPKNIVLVLDTSGSMEGHKLDMLKQAAKRIVSTLTVADRIAIVQFSDAARLLAGSSTRLYTATKENIQMFLDFIDGMNAIGRTNFFDSLNLAFSVMDETISQELNVDCNSAILFLTDGYMNVPEDVTEDEVIALVATRLTHIEAATGHPVFLFTYSISERHDDVHIFPRRLACSTENGVWSKIVDSNKIVDSLASYYKLFALGLGQNGNDDFVAWVEPYHFATGGILGTTVSTPIYDRTKDPHLFVGVAAFDFTLAAIDKALGLEAGSQEALDQVVLASTARCPSLDLSLCALESFRRQGVAGIEALCRTNCTDDDFVEIEAEKCPFVHDYPQDLWQNNDDQPIGYLDSVCCVFGEQEASPDECPAQSDEDTVDEDSVATVVIVVVAIIAVVLIYLVGAVAWRRCATKRASQTPETPVANWMTASPAPEVIQSAVILPPPSAPPEQAVKKLSKKEEKALVKRIKAKIKNDEPLDTDEEEFAFEKDLL